VTPYYSPSRDARDSEKTRGKVAERLRSAVELEQAAQLLRETAAVGRHTEADKRQLDAAEMNWDATKIRDWQIPQ
jgi:Ribonuclease G/E